MESKNNKSIYAEEGVLSTFEMIRFAIGGLGYTIAGSLLSGFILVFGVSMIGLPAAFVGPLYSVGLIVSAFASPFFGGLSDNLKAGKWGKRKPMILIGAPLFAICAIWLWSIPPTDIYGEFVPSIAIQFTSALVFYRIMEAVFGQPYNAMLPEISRDEQNRVKTSMFTMSFSMFGGIIGMFIPMIFIANIEEIDENSTELWLNDPSGKGLDIYNQLFPFIIIVMVVFILCMSMVIFTIKTPKMVEDPDAEKVKMNVLATLSEPFKDKNCMKYLFSMFLFNIPGTALLYLLMNFLIYVLGVDGIWYYICIVIILFVMVISFVFWDKSSKKDGIKKAYKKSLMIFGFALLLMIVIILVIPLGEIVKMIVGLIIIGAAVFGMVGGMIFPSAILSDIIDQAENRTMKSQAGNYYGAYNFLNSLSSAVSMFVVSMFMEILGETEPIGYIVISIVSALLIPIAIPLYNKLSIVGKKIEK
ncbi:MAG: MFS transporter [archaeon]|nr:MFS transporter [archaeon]